MRSLAVALAVLLLIAALPLIVRLDSALHGRRPGRAVLEAGRLVLATAAASALLLIAVRAR